VFVLQGAEKTKAAKEPNELAMSMHYLFLASSEQPFSLVVEVASSTPKVLGSTPEGSGFSGWDKKKLLACYHTKAQV
jgi:hypothetical protein